MWGDHGVRGGRAIFISCAAILAGCAGAPLRRDAAVPALDVGREAFVAGTSVEGREIPCVVLGGGPDVCMIIATIHGNEAAGTPLVHRLEREVLIRPELLSGRCLVLVSVANPDGMATNRRTNVNGVDLNRNFPADSFRPTRRHGPRPLSEPESRVLRDLVYRYNPDRVVSIHQPVACVDWDGPGEGLARAMSGLSGLQAKRIGSLPGSFGSWVGLALGRPIITLELPRSADALDDDASWDRYGAMLVHALVWPRRL